MGNLFFFGNFIVFIFFGFFVFNGMFEFMMVLDGIIGFFGLGDLFLVGYLFILGVDDVVKFGGGFWSMFFDCRLKEDICNFEDGFELFMSICLVWYCYNGKLNMFIDKDYIGIIV